MTLSAHEIKRIQDSFQLVEPISDQAAEIFYNKLFEYDPALKSLFKRDIKEQGRMLMTTLKIAVNSLNNMKQLTPVLENLARNHLDYGVKVDDYTPVGNALIYTLKTGLGEQFTPELKSAWTKAYKIMADIMRSAAYPGFDAEHYKNTKHYHHGEVA